MSYIKSSSLPGEGTGQTDTVSGATGITNTGDNTDAVLAPTYGTDSETVCQGNDSRLSDARTPTAHATSHQSGGGDAVKLDDLAAPDDNTDLDATTSKHGLLPKLGGGTSNFLRADGSWAAPAGGGGSLTLIHLAKSSLVDNMGGANGTKQQIRWDSELRKDTGFTHDNATNPSRIQVDADGRYRVRAAVSGQQGGSARTTLMLYFRVDGTTEVLRCVARNYSRGSGYGDISNVINTDIDLTNGQYIEIQTEVDDSDSSYTINTITAQCECIVERIE